MATKEGSTEKSESPTDDPTVLFVDDEPALLETYEALYRSEFTVLTANSGAKALERFGDHIDFAFFDRRMPEMSGDDTIRTLREMGFQTPVAMVSAVEQENDFTVETAAYLVKPVDKRLIEQTVTKALS
jgi:CheY-like chemotaxis protein